MDTSIDSCRFYGVSIEQSFIIEGDPEEIFDDLLVKGPALNSEDLGKYVQCHIDRLLFTNAQDGKNILHHHAAKSTLPARHSNVYQVIAQVLRMDHGAEMMGKADEGLSTGKTPLEVAISSRNYAWIQFVLSLRHEPDPPKLDWHEIIAKTGMKGRNCLHEVFHCTLKHPTYHAVVKELIDLADPASFTVFDSDACTPLHLALDAEHLTEEMVPIIGKLLEKNSISDDYCLAQPRYESPHQYFKRKRQDWKRTTAMGDPGPKKQSRPDIPGMGSMSRDFRAEEREASSAPSIVGLAPGDKQPGYCAMGGLQMGSATFSGRNQPRVGPGPGSLPTSYLALPVSSTSAANTSRPRTSTPSATPQVQGETKAPTPEGDALEAKLNKPAATGAIDAHIKLLKNVKTMLKLHYLHNLPTTRAVDVLYGDNLESKQIFLDFSQDPTESTPTKTFRKRYDKLNLARTLKYVELRNMEFSDGTDPDSGELVIRHLDFVFQWLKGKRVHRILRLNVDDSVAPYNEDEDIEKCIGDLQIEQLNWKKFDLCLDTKYLRDSMVNHLILYWRGSTAVLRGWSGGDQSLRALPELTTVEVILKRDVKLTTRRLEDFKFFKQDIQQGSDDRITVEDLKQDCEARILPPHVPEDQTKASDDESGDRHKWIGVMEKVGNALARFASHVPDPLASSPSASKIGNGIKIAIIDDGIDVRNSKVAGSVVGGGPVCRHPSEEGVAHYRSTTGHGTSMAMLILRIFPMAQIYSFKLEPLTVVSGTGTSVRHSFHYESAVKAIELATRFEVDIICMSWAVSRSDDPVLDTQMDQAFEPVIKHAADGLHERPPNQTGRTPILLFCAVEDTGRNNPDTSYPGNLCNSSVLRIGAATGLGDIWPVTNDAAHFLLPGAKVDEPGEAEHYYGTSSPASDLSASSPSTPSQQQHRVITGSSVSTALAAGLAGIILYLARVSAILMASGEYEGKDYIDSQGFADLHKHDVMDKVFRKMCDSKINFVRAWDTFQPILDTLDNRQLDSKKKMEDISRLVWKLCA